MNNELFQKMLSYVRETRRYGQTYVHAAVRCEVPGYEGMVGEIDGRAVKITYSGWGRSLQSKRGHKYKAHARFVDTDKPVPTKLLG